jgi:hypothetical protein
MKGSHAIEMCRPAHACSWRRFAIRGGLLDKHPWPWYRCVVVDIASLCFATRLTHIVRRR